MHRCLQHPVAVLSSSTGTLGLSFLICKKGYSTCLTSVVMAKGTWWGLARVLPGAHGQPHHQCVYKSHTAHVWGHRSRDPGQKRQVIQATENLTTVMFIRLTRFMYFIHVTLKTNEKEGRTVILFHCPGNSGSERGSDLPETPQPVSGEQKCIRRQSLAGDHC